MFEKGYSSKRGEEEEKQEDSTLVDTKGDDSAWWIHSLLF